MTTSSGQEPGLPFEVAHPDYPGGGAIPDRPVTDPTPERLRDRLDTGETITMTHPDHGVRTYANPQDGKGYTLRWSEGDDTRRHGPTEILGWLRADLLDGWTIQHPATIADDQITALRDEAGAAGDLDQVAVCDRALAGDADARAECQRVIADAAAMES